MLQLKYILITVQNDAKWLSPHEYVLKMSLGVQKSSVSTENYHLEKVEKNVTFLQESRLYGIFKIELIICVQ